MNKHFHDSRYYLSRAAEHAKLGLSETLEPYATRLRATVGRNEEPEPEPTPLEAVREELLDLERNARNRPVKRPKALERRSRVPQRTSPTAASERKS